MDIGSFDRGMILTIELVKCKNKNIKNHWEYGVLTL